MYQLRVSINIIEMTHNDFHARFARKCIERRESRGSNFLGTDYIQIYDLTSPLSPDEIIILNTLQERGVISRYTIEELLEDDDIA